MISSPVPFLSDLHPQCLATSSLVCLLSFHLQIRLNGLVVGERLSHTFTITVK